ncbi:MAG: ATP-binding protein [Bacteroidetes bacterium]|nr:ATP-binding protein [Bacteroidota bacterium]
MNPFPIAGYIGKEYFCDREKETKLIIDGIKNGRNQVVYGWRRLGKSALLFHVLSEMEKQKHLGIYVDLYGTKSLAQATENIADAIINATQGQKGISQKLAQLVGRLGASLSFDPFTAMPKLSFGINQHQEKGEQNLLALYKYLSSEYKKVIVVLDEFQQITQYENSINPEAVFRSLMQQFPNIRFIYSGSQRNLMLSMFNDSNRPFYRSCELLLIEEIAIKAYSPFILEKMNKRGQKITSEQIETIYQWTNGQTLYIQMVCNKLFARNKKVDNEALLSTFKELIEQQSHYFQHINELLTRKQSDLMRAIAIEGVAASPTANDFLNKHQLGTSGTITRTLNSLVSKTLVIKTTTGYRLHDTLLSRWYEHL